MAEVRVALDPDSADDALGPVERRHLDGQTLDGETAGDRRVLVSDTLLIVGAGDHEERARLLLLSGQAFGRGACDEQQGGEKRGDNDRKRAAHAGQ